MILKKKQTSPESQLTLVTIQATETRIADAGEVSRRLADAAPSRAADVGGDVPHPIRVIGRYSNGAAVNHCEEMKTQLKLISFL